MGWHWQLVTPYNAHDGSTTKNYPAPNVNSVQLRNPGFEYYPPPAQLTRLATLRDLGTRVLLNLTPCPDSSATCLALPHL